LQDIVYVARSKLLYLFNMFRSHERRLIQLRSHHSAIFYIIWLTSNRRRQISLISLFNSFYTFKLYSTIRVPVALYGCETWSLKLREERRLKVNENRVLGRLFGSKMDEGTGLL